MNLVMCHFGRCSEDDYMNESNDKCEQLRKAKGELIKIGRIEDRIPSLLSCCSFFFLFF